MECNNSYIDKPMILFMKQESLIQIITIIILGGLTLFYNPISADFEGKILFFLIIISVILLFVLFDFYKQIEDSKLRINLFNEKLSIHERIKNLEHKVNI
jgi:hypothetical protein